MQLQTLGIGVTTKDPNSGPVPVLGSVDQCWFVIIWSGSCKAWQSGACTAWHEGRKLQWVLDRSAGKTFGCHVSETGELHLHHNGRDVGVALEGLPTDQPLWGVVILDGGWKVEASYAIPKGEAVMCVLVCMSIQLATEVEGIHLHVCSSLCLFVYCPNSCGKKMKLADVENHLTSENGCPDHVVECTNKCGHKERRATMQKHMTTECCLRQEKCKYYSLDCPNKCGARGVTHSTFPVHQEVCPMQRMECEYKRFGCAIILPRKDMAQHLKSSVEAHLQMTKRRVEEMEEKAERERQRVNNIIARLVVGTQEVTLL